VGRSASLDEVATMDIIGWIGWALLSTLGVLWTVIWFLISGWVSSLLQIAVLVVSIYFLKYGWQRAPSEIWQRTRAFGRYLWSWLRARESRDRIDADMRETVRAVSGKEFGDVNVSTLLSLLTLAGLILLAQL
jgi:hypothetical protein